MVLTSAVNQLCRPLSLQLTQSVIASGTTTAACTLPVWLQRPASSSHYPRRQGLCFLATAHTTTSDWQPSGAAAFASERTQRILPSRFSRRPLMRGFIKGLLGFMVIGSAGGMSTGTPSALARAKNPEIEKVLKEVEWPEEFPFTAKDFERYDETPDTTFYTSPRFVTHIDDYAIKALTKYYDSVFPPSNTPGVAVLDLCSSWISHFPAGYKQERIAGLGLNEAELKENKVLTEFKVQDLNVNPKLPYEDNSFDVIVNAVSVDYLKRPREIFKEMHRVLKPGGLCAMSFSNRCFWTKAISIWTGTSDVDHVYIVGAYFHYTGGFEPPQALDISPNPGRSDPMYVVYSRKPAQ